MEFPKTLGSRIEFPKVLGSQNGVPKSIRKLEWSSQKHWEARMEFSKALGGQNRVIKMRWEARMELPEALGSYNNRVTKSIGKLEWSYQKHWEVNSASGYIPKKTNQIPLEKWNKYFLHDCKTGFSRF